jgi:hypothetical protein
MHWLRLASTLVVCVCAAACSSAPGVPTPTIVSARGATSTPVPTAAPTLAPAATAARGASTSSSGTHDYKSITQPLLLPLGALIVAVRAGTPTTDYWLGQFNTAADTVLGQIDGDTSDTANQLRTGIASIRANPKDLQTLEDTRSKFLSIT